MSGAAEEVEKVPSAEAGHSAAPSTLVATGWNLGLTLYLAAGALLLIGLAAGSGPRVSLLALLGLLACAVEIAGVARASWRNPRTVGLANGEVIARWRGGRAARWAAAELRRRRPRTWLGSMVGGCEFLDAEGRTVFRVWPQMLGHRALCDAVREDPPGPSH